MLPISPLPILEKRGNSLFAEVDDQRQHMKRVLAAQKTHYAQMKVEYGRSQQEIRSLKRENAAMKKELEICAAMFMNADRTYKRTCDWCQLNMFCSSVIRITSLFLKVQIN